MRVGFTARVATSLVLTVGGIVMACRNNVPGPTLPTPVAPEVTREAPKPQPIDPTNARPAPDLDDQAQPDAGAGGSAAASSVQVTHRVSAAYGQSIPMTEDEPVVEPPTKEAPTDAGVSDVIDLPPVPDADVEIVIDAGQPLQ